MLYLLQLVQALKFERGSGHHAHRSTRDATRHRETTEPLEEEGGLSQFLITRSAANPLLGTSFHWYLMIECVDRGSVGKMYAKVAFNFMKRLSEVSYKIRIHFIPLLTSLRHLRAQHSAMC